MPFFSSSRHNDAAPVEEPVRPTTPPHQSRNIFSRRSRSADRPEPAGNGVGRSATLSSSRHSPSASAYGNGGQYSDTRSSRGGWFGRRRSSSSDDYSNNIGHDPTIINARGKVADAEAAERDADQALINARMAVREARDHVRYLEREAMEEARRAKMKQDEAKSVSKSARGLGRHG